MTQPARQHAAFDTSVLKTQFPLFANHPDLVFLDSAASSQKPQCVIDSLTYTYSHCYANVHRGVYEISQETTRAYEKTRHSLKRLFNTATVENIVFARGATEAINLVAHSWGKTNLKAGDTVVLTEAEHHANLVPWQMLRDALGISLKFVPIQNDGSLNLEDFKKALTSDVKLTAFPHVSNVLGTVFPIEKMVSLAKEKGITTLIDGCQAVPRLPVDVQNIGADFYVFSGHKMYAPNGCGGLLTNGNILDDMPPWQGGGDMIKHVALEKTIYADPPARFEAGTPNIAETIALGTAAEWLMDIGMENIAAHETELTQYAHAQLRNIDGLTFVGETTEKIGVVAFNLKNIPASDVGMLLDEQNIAVRCGHHCAEPLHQRLGITATVRASFGVHNTRVDVDALGEGLKKVNKIMRR